MIKNIFPALLLACGIAFAGFFIGNALADLKTADRHVSVKGLAERVVKSDKAIWLLQFNYSSDDLKDLYKGIALSQQTIKGFLLKKGFVATEIEMQPVAVVDNQSNSYSSNEKAKRFIATAGITLTSSKVDAVREAVQATGELVQEGVVLNLSSVQYLFTQLNAIKPAMLNEATTNATLAAESFAKNAHSRLGAIRSASQGLFIIEDASGGNAGTAVMKQVRIVTTMDYFLKDK